MTDLIRGAVASILNRRELVLNIGTAEGVEPGMRFAVLSANGIAVRDPETNEELGSVEVPKVLVEATRVQEKLTVARTFRSHRENIGGSGASLAFAGMFSPPKYVDVPETLRLKDNPDKETLSEEESYVKIGDPVVQVIGDEFL